jgi:hypothetical protein
MVTIFSSFVSRSAAGLRGARAERRLLALAFWAGACTAPSAAPVAAPPPAPERSAAPAEAAVPDCALPERSLPTGPFAAELRELASLSNVGRLAIGVEQPRYGARRVPAPRARTAFPKVRFQTVDAHAYRYWDPLPPSILAAFPGCDEHALAGDGRLCPSATLPAKRLSAAQAAELLELVALPDPRFRFRCDFDPHHAFVFRDTEGRPVAELQVCFGCGEWMLDDEGPRPFQNGAFARLAALCRDLELGGCPPVDPKVEPELWRSYREWLGSGAPPRPSVALGIPGEVRLSALSPEQRAKLCAYRAVESARFDPDASESARYELDDGREFWLQTYDECLAEFPKCDVPLAAVEGVPFHRTSAPGRPFAQSFECLSRAVFGPIGECLWGVGRTVP